MGVVSRFATEKPFKTWEGACFSKENCKWWIAHIFSQ